MPMAWDAATMTTGLATVDRQHQELFQQVGRLHEAMTQGRGRNEVAKVLDFLGNYVAQHFAQEERSMKEFQCPAAATNAMAHAQFLAKFKALREQFERQGGSAAVVLSIHKTLTDWLVQHIQTVDVKLKPCVEKAKGAKPVTV